LSLYFGVGVLFDGKTAVCIGVKVVEKLDDNDFTLIASSVPF
jgi:hypothetical protein